MKRALRKQGLAPCGKTGAMTQGSWTTRGSRQIVQGRKTQKSEWCDRERSTYTYTALVLFEQVLAFIVFRRASKEFWAIWNQHMPTCLFSTPESAKVEVWDGRVDGQGRHLTYFRYTMTRSRSRIVCNFFISTWMLGK